MEDTLSEIRTEAPVRKLCHHTNPREDVMTPIKTVELAGGKEEGRERENGGGRTSIRIGWRENEAGVCEDLQAQSLLG